MKDAVYCHSSATRGAVYAIALAPVLLSCSSVLTELQVAPIVSVRVAPTAWISPSARRRSCRLSPWTAPARTGRSASAAGPPRPCHRHRGPEPACHRDRRGDLLSPPRRAFPPLACVSTRPLIVLASRLVRVLPNRRDPRQEIWSPRWRTPSRAAIDRCDVRTRAAISTRPLQPRRSLRRFPANYPGGNLARHRAGHGAPRRQQPPQSPCGAGTGCSLTTTRRPRSPASR